MKRSPKSPPPTVARNEAAGGASTLRELGVPGELALDLETALHALGAVSGNAVAGFSFVKPDGARYRLKVERDPPAPAADRAA